MIQLLINGEVVKTHCRCLQDLLAEKYASHERFAVAVNEQFISKENYIGCVLKGGDRVELVTPMQGG